MSEHVVKVDHVYKEYFLGNQKLTALTDISLLVREGEFLAISGPSGSGKSTLLNLIGCIDKATEGRILIDDTDVTDLSADERARLRARQIGFIFQTFNLVKINFLF